MIIGIGTDIVEISRIENAIKKQSFLKKYFTINELSLFSSKSNYGETVAGNFAAKEAVSKSMGSGFRGFGADEIEILRDELGKPYIKLYGQAFEKSKNMEINNFHISISHCDTYAVAYVIAEG